MVLWGSVHDFVLFSKPSEDVEGMLIESTRHKPGMESEVRQWCLVLKPAIQKRWNDILKADETLYRKKK